MIVEERMQTYINSLDMGNTPFLQELETKALADRVPIIRRDMQSIYEECFWSLENNRSAFWRWGLP